MSYNLPPGCRESDIPGYHDREVEITLDCDNCGPQEVEVVIDGNGDWDDCCPVCARNYSGTYEVEPNDPYDSDRLDTNYDLPGWAV